MGNGKAGDSLPWAEDRVARDPRLAGEATTENTKRAATSSATAGDTSLERRLSGYAYPEVQRTMVKNLAARKAVEKARAGKVKNRLSHRAWKSRQHPRDSHFPTASTAAVHKTNSCRTDGDISIEVNLGTFLSSYDTESVDAVGSKLKCPLFVASEMSGSS